MDKTEFINYKALRQEASQLRTILCQLSAERYSVPTPDYSGTPRSGRSKGAAFERKIIKYTEAISLYEKKLADIDARTVAVEQAIGTLADPIERLVMRLRYIEGRRWINVCVVLQDLGYSERQVYRLHGSALEKLKGV
jgi:hypothetical protein